MDLAVELQKIYDSEINVEIGSFRDGGIEVRLGDKMSDYVAEETPTSTAEIIPWFQEAIAHFFPTSAYASTLDADVRQRGADRIFRPPRVGATVVCPNCGAPNASPGFDKVMIFYCAHCGNSVELKNRQLTDDFQPAASALAFEVLRYFRFVGEICGSPIRSNGGRKFGSLSPRT